jgi:hypothetical protein
MFIVTAHVNRTIIVHLSQHLAFFICHESLIKSGVVSLPHDGLSTPCCLGIHFSTAHLYLAPFDAH